MKKDKAITLLITCIPKIKMSKTSAAKRKMRNRLIRISVKLAIMEGIMEGINNNSLCHIPKKMKTKMKTKITNNVDYLNKVQIIKNSFLEFQKRKLINYLNKHEINFNENENLITLFQHHILPEKQLKWFKAGILNIRKAMKLSGFY